MPPTAADLANLRARLALLLEPNAREILPAATGPGAGRRPGHGGPVMPVAAPQTVDLLPEIARRLEAGVIAIGDRHAVAVVRGAQERSRPRYRTGAMFAGFTFGRDGLVWTFTNDVPY